MAVPPTKAPHQEPSVRPAIKTITVINSILGTIMSENPIPIARAQKIDARTKLFSFIWAFI